MRDARICSTIVSLALLAGCASGWDRSYGRWTQYSAIGSPHARWAGCIRDRSYRYLDRLHQSDAEVVAGNDAQLFSHVLADCREFMSGEAWAHLSDREVQRLNADAYQAFGMIRADVVDQATAEITGTQS
jgi:hypothetical protein